MSETVKKNKGAHTFTRARTPLF